MNQKKTKKILRVVGLVLALLAFSNLVSGIWKSYQDRHAFTIWTGQTDDGAMVQRKEGNKMETLHGEYRVQLPAQTHVPIGNVRSWLLTSAAFLGLGLSCLLCSESLGRQTQQHEPVD